MALYLEWSFLVPCCDISTHFQEYKAPDKQVSLGDTVRWEEEDRLNCWLDLASTTLASISSSEQQG